MLKINNKSDYQAKAKKISERLCLGQKKISFEIAALFHLAWPYR